MISEYRENEFPILTGEQNREILERDEEYENGKSTSYSIEEIIACFDLAAKGF